MYEYQAEPDHENDEEEEDQEVDDHLISDEPEVKSFYDRYGFDERDGLPEDEEEHGYRDDPDLPKPDDRIW